MTVARAALGLAAIGLIAPLPACFHPNYEHVACGPDDRCPGGTSCNRTTGFYEGPGGGPIADAAVSDGAGLPPDAPQCFGAGLLKNLCLTSVPTGNRTLTISLNTDQAGTCTQVLPQSGSPAAAPELCVITGRTVTVQGSVAATGTRALVLIAADTLVVAANAALDASSTTSGASRRGAGANLGACSAPSKPDSSTGGGGGGAGGSLSTKGGDGGDGNRNGTPLPSKGGRAGSAQPAPVVLRGGCPGGKGGDGQAPGGAGGDGGGALYLIAGTSITIIGDVFASGGGGDATPSSNGIEQGGGGGGTGGMIGLDAPSITINGRLAANGGAGGGGGGLTKGGTPGGDGTTAAWNQRAPGGGPGAGGSGVLAGGAPGTAVNQISNIDGPIADGGGGGAGGGLGFVTVYGTLSGGTTISPAPVLH